MKLLKKVVNVFKPKKEEEPEKVSGSSLMNPYGSLINPVYLQPKEEEKNDN